MTIKSCRRCLHCDKKLNNIEETVNKKLCYQCESIKINKMMDVYSQANMSIVRTYWCDMSKKLEFLNI
jgi:NMD protein affecting ribosome stability and mRNA decay